MNGSATLRKGSATIFQGTARGIVYRNGSDIGLELDIDVVVDIDVEVEIEGFEFGRIWTCDATNQPAPATAHLHVSYGAGPLTVTGEGQLGLCLAVAELTLTEVIDIPEETICGYVPKLDGRGLPVFEQAVDGDGNLIFEFGLPVMVPVFVEECITTPAVVISVPDGTELGAPVRVDASVSVDLGASDPVHVELESSTFVPNGLTVQLPDLLPGI